MASEHDLHTSETEFVRVCSTTAKHDKRAVACGCLSMLSLLATAVLSVFLLLGFEGAVAPALICLAFSLCFLLLTHREEVCRLRSLDDEATAFHRTEYYRGSKR